MKRLHNIMEIEREVNIKPDENEWGSNQVNCFINAMLYYSILKRVMQGTLYLKYICRKCGMCEIEDYIWRNEHQKIGNLI